MIARAHLGNMQKTGRAKLSWIAARNPENLEKVRAEFNVPYKTQNYKHILNDPAVDLHKEMFMETFKAGKHVLLEKHMEIIFKCYEKAEKCRK